MKRITCLAAVITGIAAVTPAAASTLSERYTSFWSLGDSLTDDGNLFAISPVLVPSPPYFDGRVSNGPTYSEGLADEFDAAGKPNDNLAYASARAVTNGDPVPDLQLQAESPFPIYADGKAGLRSRSGDFGDRPLVTLFFGANDVLGSLGPTEDPIAAAIAAANKLIAETLTLSAGGISDFALLNLPDLGVIPQVTARGSEDSAAATAASVAFNDTLTAGIMSFTAENPDVTVTEVDVFSAFNEILAEPGALGLTNLSDPCLDLSGPFPTICSDPDSYVFFDEIHPTAKVHLALGDTLRQAILATPSPTPVPLPATGLGLAAALVALGAARRRARRTA